MFPIVKNQSGFLSECIWKDLPFYRLRFFFKCGWKKLLFPSAFLLVPDLKHLLYLSSRRSSGSDLGYPADATCHRRPHPGLYRRRGDQQRAVGFNTTRLDRHLLQQLPGDPACLKARRRTSASPLDFSSHSPAFSPRTRTQLSSRRVFG